MEEDLGKLGIEAIPHLEMPTFYNKLLQGINPDRVSMPAIALNGGDDDALVVANQYTQEHGDHGSSEESMGEQQQDGVEDNMEAKAGESKGRTISRSSNSSSSSISNSSSSNNARDSSPSVSSSNSERTRHVVRPAHVFVQVTNAMEHGDPSHSTTTRHRDPEASAYNAFCQDTKTRRPLRRVLNQSVCNMLLNGAMQLEDLRVGVTTVRTMRQSPITRSASLSGQTHSLLST